MTIALLVGLTGETAAFCPHEPTIQEEYESSKCVLIAEVLSKEDVLDDEGFISSHRYDLRSLRSLKGTPPEEIRVHDENDSGRFYMEVGRQYLLFIGDMDSIEIDACGHSALLSESEDLLKIVIQLAEAER